MSFGTWRFKSSHPHSETSIHPRCGGCGRRGSLRQRRRRRPGADDGGHRDARRALADRSVAHGCGSAAPSIAAVQARAEAKLLEAIPSAQIVYRYRLVADGFALVVPTRDVTRLTSIPGIAKVWPNLTYHELSVTRTAVTRADRLNQGPQVIGADKLWGTSLATAGEGMKIGVIDDGIDAKHVFFDPAVVHVPGRLPEGADAQDDAEGDRPAGVRAEIARVRPRQHPVRPVAERIVPRDPRRRNRRGRPQHPGWRAVPLRRRTGRLPRKLQGAHHPDARVRPRRQLGPDRGRDRGRGRGRDERDQPLARRARDLAGARLRGGTRSTRPQRPASCR